MPKIWDKSGQVEFDDEGEAASGALAYFYEGGTTTPLTVYEDADETTPHDVPVEAAAFGRWPLVFIPYCTSYDVKVTTEAGTQLYYYNEIPNPDPVEAASDTATAEELIQTGQVIWWPKEGSATGFVRCNGRTIGSGASGGSERANADTSDLYTFLWTHVSDTYCPVTGGRGASAAADFSANKPIGLPDLRGGSLFGLQSMGNSDSGRFTGVPIASATAGATVGGNTCTLTTVNLPAHLHSISITSSSDNSHNHTGTVDYTGTDHTHTTPTSTGTTSADHVHTVKYSRASIPTGTGVFVDVVTNVETGGSQSSQTQGQSADHSHAISTPTSGMSVNHQHTFSTSTQAAHSHTVSGNTGNTGSDTAHNNVPYGIQGTFYMKL